MKGRRIFFACVLLCTAAGTTSSAVDPAALIAEIVRTGSAAVRDIEFANQSATVSKESAQALRAIRSVLIEHDEWSVEVRVYSVASGRAARDLAVARAEAIVAYLIREGVPATRLVPRGYSADSAPTDSAPVTRAGPDRVELKKLNEE